MPCSAAGSSAGRSTLLIGPPGSGKSTIAVQYAAAAAQRGDHAAAFLLDETKAALLARSAGIGMTFKEGLGPGEIMLRQIDPAAISPGGIRAPGPRLRRARCPRRDHRQPQRIPEHDAAEQFLTAQLHELLSYLNLQGVATFLVVAQSGMMGAAMTSPVDASYLADSVVMLRYFEHAGEVKKAISVVKKRTGAHERANRGLEFDARGIHLSEPLMALRGVLTGVPVEVPVATRRETTS